MNRRLRIAILSIAVVGIFSACSPICSAAEKKFPLVDGDTWVMAGDSITAQHLHSNYFEAFCYARFPQLTFRFRNSGVGGDTIPKLLARYDWDVAPWKPTVVSVELGMNDQGGFSVEQYLTNMGQLDQKIKSTNARAVYLTASPINNGDTMARLAAGNKKLDQYAVGLKSFAAERYAPFADQFHALVDIWGHNKPRENQVNLIATVRAAAGNDQLEGVEHLRAFLSVQGPLEKGLVSLQGDPVHPGPPGQLMMAAALLKDLGAPDFVSSATINAAGQVSEAKGCKIENVKADGGKISFDRLDECLPFPIPNETRTVLPLYPTIVDLSQYTLKVGELTSPIYELKINGQPVATVSSKELGEGVNLTIFGRGPIAQQGQNILAAVNAKEGLVSQWRGLSKVAAMQGASEETKQQLARLAKQVDEADAKIREAAKPRTLHFELAPAK